MMAEPEPTNEALDAAISYAARGWRCLPIRPGEKRPPMTAWQTAATTDEETIRQWWTGLYRGYGVGIATGTESGIWVLDVDVAPGHDGAASYEALVEKHGELPATVTAVTGTGGFHYIFKMPADFTVRNNASTRLGPGLDIRGEGGQIVAAPTIHPCGVAYRWVTGAGPDDIEVADAPGWLLDLLRDPVPANSTAPVVLTSGTTDDSAAGWYNDNTTWPQLLTADGWTLTKTLGSGEQQWTRPGKTGREGISATVGHNGADCLMVFTTSVPELDPDRAYSRFGYEAAMRWRDDRSAFARHIRRTLMPAPAPSAAAAALEPWDPASGVPEPDPFDWANLIHWPDFWNHDHDTQQWAIYPLIPAGRAVGVSAPAKAGKSWIILTAVLAAVTGQAAFGGPAPEQPVRVLYLDYEMTLEDLAERMTELGYGPETDISGLHYALLPSLPPLDTPAGIAHVLQLVDHYQIQVVVIDTFGRAVEGEENSADTVRDYYRHTGLALKTRGVAVLRTDHTGKDTTRGTRGTSAKQDDLDVVWQLTRDDDGVTLKRTHSRVGWVPEKVELTRHEDHDGVVTFKATNAGTWPAGTKDMADDLDRLGVPVDIPIRDTAKAFRAAGGSGKNAVIFKAQKYRQERVARDLEWAGNTPGNAIGPVPRGTAGGTRQPNGEHAGQSGGTAGERGGTPGAQSRGNTPLPYKGSGVARPAPETPEIDTEEELALDLFDEDGNEIHYPTEEQQ